MGFSPMRLAETFGVGEIPSGNAYGNARGLATIGAAMANRGVFKGTKVNIFKERLFLSIFLLM